MTWVAHLVRTMDGRLGARLDLAGEGSWSIPLNGIEEFSVTVGKDQLARLDPSWWSPYRSSVAVSWQREDGSLVAWVAGPIVGPPTETRATASFDCRGIGAILSRRVLTAQEPISQSTAAQVAMMTGTVRYAGMSLGTIAQEVVKRGVAKVGGTLPIAFGSPREQGSTLNERTYEGFNLANNGVWKRLTELSGVRNGPDIAFRPRWTADGQFLEWVMVHGTYAQPTIEQAWTADLDATSSMSPIASVSVTTDASRLASRVYWTGAGEGKTTMVRVAEDRSRLADQMPILETVGSTSDSGNRDLIRAHAIAELEASRAPVTQISVQIDGADPRCEIGRWRVGDAARLTMGDEWLTVPPGTTTKRIISAKGSWSSAMVDLEFQDDSIPTPDDYEEEPE